MLTFQNVKEELDELHRNSTVTCNAVASKRGLA